MLEMVIDIIKSFLRGVKTGKITVHVKEGKLSGIEVSESHKL